MASILVGGGVLCGGVAGAVGGGLLAGTTHWFSSRNLKIEGSHRHALVNMAAQTSKVLGYGLSVFGGAAAGAGSALTYFQRVCSSGGYTPALAPTLPEMLSDNFKGVLLGTIGLGLIVLGRD